MTARTATTSPAASGRVLQSTWHAIIPDDADVGQATAQIGFADGTSTTLLLGYSNGADFATTSCSIWGQALSG